MTMNMHEILEQIGWTNGFHVPVANAENQALEVELEKLTVRKAKAKTSYDDANAKFDALDKHLKYVKQESEQNQKLLTAYLQQVTSEREKLKQSKAEHDRVNQELRQISKHIDEIHYRQQGKKNDLSNALTKIEKLKAETMWDAEALKAWEDSLQKRDDDTDLLKNYSKTDERKVKDLDARRQNLQMEVCEKRATVEKMVAELRNYEQMQDRTDKLLKQQEEERKALVTQWQDAVKNLRQRDDDIARVNADIMRTKALIEQRQEELHEQDTFLNNEKANNRKLEMDIEDLNILNSRLRRELHELIQHILTLGNDVNTMKRHLAASSSKLSQERQVSKNQTKQLNNLKKKIAGATTENEELDRKLKEVLSSQMSSSERTKYLEQMINAEQQMTKNLVLDASRVQGILYRNQISSQELKDITKTIETQMAGIDVSNRHLEKQIKQKLDELSLQKEMVYSLEYRINEIEVKIASIEDHAKVDEEAEILNAKIAELEKTLAGYTDVKNFLHAQIARLQDEMRRLSNAITADTGRIDVLKGKLQDQVLLFDGGLKQAAAAKLKSQQKQVEENLLRLRVSQLGKAISKEEDRIYDLEKFKLELETSLREREIEIEAHQDILRADKKNLGESLGRLRADINHKKIRIDQFQKKHHLALMALGKDDDGQPLSITHFKIKDAQERYMLQQEGDELDNKIKKAEKEIVAMENTLTVVNLTNTTYKKSLAPFEEDDKEHLEMQQLEQKMCTTAIAVKQQKKALTEKRKALKQLQESITAVQEKQEEKLKVLREFEDAYKRLKEEQPLREQRLTKTIRDVKTYKKRVSKPDLEKPERNLEIRQLQDANKEAFHQLRIFLSDNEDATLIVMDLLKACNLDLPPVPSSRGSISSSTMAPITKSTQSSSSSSMDSYCAVTPVLLTFPEDVKKSSKKPKGQ